MLIILFYHVFFLFLNYWLILFFFHLVFYISLIKPRIFDKSIDSFSLNIFRSSLPRLLQTLKGSNILSQIYDILGFLNSLYLATPSTINLSYPNLAKIYAQKEFFNYWKCFSIILSFLSYSLGENKFVYFSKLLSSTIKSINPIQKYLHVIESHAFIL